MVAFGPTPAIPNQALPFLKSPMFVPEKGIRMYRSLKSDAIFRTGELLNNRIAERFPGSGLSLVSQDLLAVTGETSLQIEKLMKPHWPIRVTVVFALLLGLGAFGLFLYSYHGSLGGENVSDLLQGLEAAINVAIFLSIAIFFLLTVEVRLKRNSALKSLNELRSIAHVIDLHQMNKDPEYLVSPMVKTSSSPVRTMTRFELARYLDYCSELLSITSKVAALYVQSLNDEQIMSAVDDIQDLTIGLSAKIWQKIVILDTLVLHRETSEK